MHLFMHPLHPRCHHTHTTSNTDILITKINQQIVRLGKTIEGHCIVFVNEKT